jgi:hypothetical protein
VRSLFVRSADGGAEVVDRRGPYPVRFRVAVEGGVVRGCECGRAACAHERAVIRRRVRREVAPA